METNLNLVAVRRRQKPILEVVCVYTNNFKGQDMPRRRPQFMEGAADVEAAQLNKLSDGDELKFGGCPTQAETDS